jgi:hypothetical protein
MKTPMTIHEGPVVEKPELQLAAALEATLQAQAAVERMVAHDETLTIVMRDALEAGKIAQTMVSRLLNAVFFLGIANVVLMAALILQATR